MSRTYLLYLPSPLFHPYVLYSCMKAFFKTWEELIEVIVIKIPIFPGFLIRNSPREAIFGGGYVSKHTCH